MRSGDLLVAKPLERLWKHVWGDHPRRLGRGIRVNIDRQLIQGNGFAIPAVMLTPPETKGACVVTHGYGGCKEEQLGLAWRVAEFGLTTCVIDLRGHGENGLPYDENVLSDVEAAVQYCRRFGKVVAIGHSLGGRLSLLSKADYVIGVSPALNKAFSVQTREFIKLSRSYRVKETDPDVNFKALDNLPEWQFDVSANARILFGSRDVPEIVSACSQLMEKGAAVFKIDRAAHGDIFLLEKTFETILGQLMEWF